MSLVSYLQLKKETEKYITIYKNKENTFSEQNTSLYLTFLRERIHQKYRKKIKENLLSITYYPLNCYYKYIIKYKLCHKIPSDVQIYIYYYLHKDI